MFYINGLTGRKDGESIILPSSHRHRWYVFDSDTNEIRLFAGIILDGECIRRHFVQWSARIIEQFERLITGIGDCSDDLEVLDFVDCFGTCQVPRKMRSRGQCEGQRKTLRGVREGLEESPEKYLVKMTVLYTTWKCRTMLG